jgi:hypothetical protein
VAGTLSLLVLVLAVALASCHRERPRSDMVRFEGACDASGAVPLDDHRFLVVDDEEDLVRVYDARVGGAPLQTLTFSPALPLSQGKRPEADLEGAARLGDRLYFLASHARRRSGKLDAHRRLFFATELPSASSTLPIIGEPYQRLLADMIESPSLSRFNLGKAAELGPSEPGGLNCEGLSADGNGSLLIGFRNPRPDGKALLVRLSNPHEVLRGQPALLENPQLLDLGGLGITALVPWRTGHLILAGPAGGPAPFRLYRLQPGHPPEAVTGVALDDLHPEGFFAPAGSGRILVLSDDGTSLVEGQPCKKASARQRAFRGRWIAVPP